MKITARDFPALVKQPGTTRALLIYGVDEGQVREQAKAAIAGWLGAAHDPLNLTELTGAQLKDDPAALADALNSLSLLGGEQLVWLRDPIHTQAPLIEEVLQDDPPLRLLITVGELPATSRLRKWFEKQKTVAILPCYRDDARQLGQLVADRLREQGVRAEPDALRYLTSHLGNDRAVTLQELDKILLYLGDERTLTLDQATTLLGDNSDLTMDDLCHAVAGGQPARLTPLLHRLYADGTQPIAITRILHGHFQKLAQLQSQIDGGQSEEQALERARIFFKHKPAFTQQLRRWRKPSLTRAMHALLEQETQLKSGTVPAELTCSELLHRLSRSAAR